MQKVVPDMGIPVSILPGILIMDCNFGPERHGAAKASRIAERNAKLDVDHSQHVKPLRKMIKIGHKLGCPASIHVKETFVVSKFEEVNNLI